MQSTKSNARADSGTNALLLRYPRLSALAWDGHSATAEPFLNALHDNKSEFPSYVQRYASHGTHLHGKKVTTRSPQHTHLHRQFPHVFRNFSIKNPFPTNEAKITEVYFEHIPEREQAAPDLPRTRDMAIHTNTTAELALAFPDIESQYMVNPEALNILDVEFGGILLSLISDEGTRLEINIKHPDGYGTDIIAYITARSEIFNKFDTGYSLMVKLNLDRALRMTLKDCDTECFNKIYHQVIRVNNTFKKGLRMKDEELALHFRRLILMQGTTEAKILFRTRMEASGVDDSDLTGTIDIIRLTLGELDMTRALKVAQNEDAGRGLAASTDPPKDKKPEKPKNRKEDIGNPDVKPLTPCRTCKNAGKGDQWHWHSLCPLRAAAGARANLAQGMAENVDDPDWHPFTPDYSECGEVTADDEEYAKFLESEYGTTKEFEPESIGHANIARAVTPYESLPLDDTDVPEPYAKYSPPYNPYSPTFVSAGRCYSPSYAPSRPSTPNYSRPSTPNYDEGKEDSEGKDTEEPQKFPFTCILPGCEPQDAEEGWAIYHLLSQMRAEKRRKLEEEEDTGHVFRAPVTNPVADDVVQPSESVVRVDTVRPALTRSRSVPK